MAGLMGRYSCVVRFLVVIIIIIIIIVIVVVVVDVNVIDNV